jgi:hypothetical protein
LWGVDQAAIFCAAKFAEMHGHSLKSLNVLPSVTKIMRQAQEHPRGKEGFVAENSEHSWAAGISAAP